MNVNISIQALLTQLQETQAQKTFNETAMLKKIYNTMKLRIEKKLNYADFPVCKIDPKDNLIALKSEIDKISLLGVKLQQLPEDDIAFLKAGYLLANYSLGIRMQDEKKQQFIDLKENLPVSKMLLGFFQNDKVMNGSLLELVSIVSDSMTTHLPMSELIKPASFQW